jgi:glycosyltransferase involved in cell wall biosynthesis
MNGFPMRITFILPPVNMSGGIRVISIYAKLLAERGHNVVLVSQPPEPVPLRRKLKRLVMTGRWTSSDKRQQPSHLDGLALDHRMIDSHRPVVDADVPDADVVIATFWRTGPWVAALSPSKGAKAIFLQGYETSPGYEDPAIDAVWRLPIKKIVISRWMVDLALQRFNDANVLHVPNSVDTQQFNALEARSKQPVPSVGLLYSTLHLKGVDISLRAIKLIQERFPELRVIAFGAERVVPELPLPDSANYYYLPEQGLIPKLYSACDVWLCGSRREGFHLPPLEAMACGCPVVSTKVGGPLDTIVNGENGYLVELEDAEALAEKAIEMLSLPESDWRRMSNAAIKTATSYSWNDATDRFEAALEKIAGDFTDG